MSVSESLGEQRSVELPQGTIAYRERGAGDPILFVHGLLVNGDLWRGVVPRLANDHRCIAPDWPLGSHRHPLREDADLTPPGLAGLIGDFMAALELDGVTVVANDTGGALSQILVSHRPGRVARLVLTPCDAFDNFLPPLFRPLQAMARVPGALYVVGNSLRPRPFQRLPIAFGWLAKRPFPPEISESYLSPVLSNGEIRRDVRKALRGIRSSYTLEAAAGLREFDRPVLIAWAPEDKVFPFEHAERLAKIFPDATLVEIPDAYSFVPEDQPDRLASAIAEFLTPVPA
jgi:pimeloyl-ACP methyl ester carboxylesterase